MNELEQKLQDAQNQAAVESIRADEAEATRDKEKGRADSLDGEVRALKAQLAESEKARADAENVDAEALKRKITALTAQVSREKARADAAESPDRLRAAVKERVELERQAIEVLGDKARFDEMTDRQVKIAVIERLDGAVDAQASDGYINGCFKTLVKGRANGEAALARFRETVETRKVVETRADSRTARQKFLDEQNNAWKAAR